MTPPQKVLSKWDLIEHHVLELMDQKVLSQEQLKGQSLERSSLISENNSAEYLETLNFLCNPDGEDDLLPRALEVLELKAYLKHIICEPSKREIYMVPSSKKSESDYLCLNYPPKRGGYYGSDGYFCSSLPFCECRSFYEKMKKQTSGKVMCKHLLAVLIAPLLCPEKVTRRIVPDDDLARYTTSEHYC
mmetsp:Transcript_22161/g.33386  ORF Transcript_22161/g.33386 Transcript_22161/m.33386 type:complete len:189 (+) Transcript_22161:100-666(+)